MRPMSDWIDKWRDIAWRIGFDTRLANPAFMVIATERVSSNTWPAFWIRRTDLPQAQFDIHKHLSKYGRLPADYYYTRGAHGLAYSLRCAAIKDHEVSDDVQKHSLLTLIEASLFEMSKMYANSRELNVVPAIRHINRSRADVVETYWHVKCRYLGRDFPLSCDTDWETLGLDPNERLTPTVDQIWRAIVVGHKRIFEEYALVIPEYVSRLPPELKAKFNLWQHQFDLEQAAERTRHEKAMLQFRLSNELAEVQKEKMEAERDQKRRALMAPEKRDMQFEFIPWQTIKQPELSQWVWRAPLTELAIRFGVSETAIRKAIKKWRIDAPPKGYWLSDKRFRRQV